MSVTLGLVPFQNFLNNFGATAANGRIYTRKSLAPNESELTYQDPAGLIPNPVDPTYGAYIPLDPYGRCGPIYWTDDIAYNLIVTDQTAKPQDPIYTINNYVANGSGGGGDIIVNQDFHNHLTNGQFYFPCTIPSPLPANNPEQMIPIARGGWYFNKSNTNATDTISVNAFILGQTDVPYNPPNYVQYQNSAVGSGGETFKYIAQNLGSVNLFSGEAISLALQVLSPSNSQIQLVIRQYFGTGGAPSTTVDTLVSSYTGSASWGQASGTMTIPSVAGKTLGTNGDDQLIFLIKIPLNQVCDISFTNAQLLRGSVILPYEVATQKEVFALINAKSPGYVGERKEVYYEATENQGNWDGWFKADGRSLSRAVYADLFSEIGTTWGSIDSGHFNLPPSGGLSTMGSGSTSGYTTRTIGQIFGEENHQLTINELASHHHSYDQSILVNAQSSGPLTSLRLGSQSSSTGNTGGDAGHNTIHPVTVTCVMIKFRQ